MLGRGNGKLGRQKIHTFSLEAGVTCPGKTLTQCILHCYADKGFFLMPTVKKRYRKNLKASQQDYFVSALVAEIEDKECQIVRIHVSGDFYSPEYVLKWIMIANQCPAVRFYAYTRSWRVPEIRNQLAQLSRLNNVRLWYSCDEESGLPSRKPKRVRIAWMQTSTDVSHGDVIFRIEALRKTVVKRIGLALVCPPENGITHTTCDRCGICWRN